MKTSRSFDLIVATLSLILIILIAGVLWRGDRTYPYVRANNLAEVTEVSPDHRQITLTFNREMDKKSVEENFQLSPDAEGQFSWVGRRMAYSFSEPLAYDQSYELTLADAHDSNGQPLQEPFVLNFSTPPQSLFYLNQNAQLVRQKIESGGAEPLSPEGLEVVDYRMHPNRSTFYLLVKDDELDDGTEFVSLYELDTKNEELTLLLDGKELKVFEFKVSPDGTWLVVSVGDFYALGDFWITQPPTIRLLNLKKDEWDDFWRNTLYEYPLQFSNDAQFLMGVDYSGDALILPLEEQDFPPVQLGVYTDIHGLSSDGRMILLSKAHDVLPETQLVVRKNDGSTQTIAEGLGEIYSPTFTPNGEWVYFLVKRFNFDDLDFMQSFSLQAYDYFYDLYRYSLSSLELSPVMDEGTYAQGAFDFSADGKTMVVERYSIESNDEEFISTESIFEEKVPELWRMELESGEMKTLGLLGEKPRLD